MVDYELIALRKEFLEEARDKVREIDSTLGSTQTSESLDRLAYLAHQLKGSGGSYGYQRISDESAELEKAFETMATGETKDGVDGAVRSHVKALQEEIEHGLGEL
jgi:HPt (histidine-containing phosphotransfer) domain-containing protein